MSILGIDTKRFVIPSFVKNVLALSFGTVISQGFNFLFLPFLSRLYSPEEFGLFYAFVGVCQVVGLVSTLKYEKAIILPKSDEEGNDLVLLTLSIITIYTVIVSVVLIVLNAFTINLGVVQKYILLVPVSILSYSFLSTMTLWYQREERFKLISLATIAQTFTIIVLSIVFALLKLNQNGLILGYVLGCFALVFCLVLMQYKRFHFLYQNSSRTKLLANFRAYLNFPKYYLFYDLFATGSISLIPVILTAHYSQADCGFYSMANRILMVPFIVISTSVSNVFMVTANKIYQSGKSFDGFYKKILTRIILIGLVIYSTAFFVGGAIIPILLGSKWANISLYVRILSIMVFFEFVTIVFKSNTYIIVQKQRTGMIIQIFSTVTNLFCLIVFSKYGIQVALAAFTVSSSFFSCVNLYTTYSMSKTANG
jgi:teichuronic acid exporter